MKPILLRKKSGAYKPPETELQTLTEERKDPENELKQDTSRGLLITAIVLFILALLFSVGVAGLSIYNTVIVETQVVQMIQLLNSPNSGLQIIVDGTTVFLYNTGVHNVTGGPGIEIDETNPQVPVISLNASFINCTGSGGDCELNCTNTTTFVNTTDFFNCSTCFFNGTCDCFNVTNVFENNTINNFTDIVINNITLYTNASCCLTNVIPGAGINVTGMIGSQTVSNTGVLNITVGDGLLETGPYNTPTISADFLAGPGISISGTAPLIFNNTGVIKIDPGQNVIVTSSNGDGTGIVTISVPFQINNLNPGLGINITQNATDTTITNDGVVQNFAGPGIGLTSSFGNGKGVVNITNDGTIQIFGGPGVNITGTQQFPIVNFEGIVITALAGIFVNGSNSQFDIANTGVLQINPGPGITVFPPSGTGIVNISANCPLNITAGTGITVTTSGSTKTIATNLAGGTGITLSGSHPQTISASLLAGTGIFLNGTNPIEIFSTGITSITNGTGLTAVQVNPTTFAINIFADQINQVELSTNYPKNPVPNCNIGYSVGPTIYWTCFTARGSLPNFCGSNDRWDMKKSEWTIGVNGTYYISYSIEDQFAQTAVSLVRISNNPATCIRCSTGVGSCTYQRLITVGGLNNAGATFTNAVASNVMHFVVGDVLSLQQLFSVGYGIVDTSFANNGVLARAVSYFNIYLLRPDGS